MKSGIGFLAFRLCRWASVLLVILLSLLVVSCDLWNKDMLGYLEHWSETVQLGKVEVSDATIQKNDSGVDTIPVAATPTIAAYVINPKSYALLAEIGDSSSSDRSVRISSQSVQTKAQVVAHEATMLKIQLGSADGSLEHTEFRVDFEAIRKDTMQSAGQVMGVTLQYNTPPVAPTPVVWNYDSSQHEVVKAGEKWEADRDGILYWAYDDSITKETDPNCAKWFSIGGTRHPVADCKVKPNVQVDGLSIFQFNTNYGSTSVAALDSEGVSSPAVASGQAVPPATYVIKYDANGADGGTAPTSQSKTQYTDITLATNSGGLTRIGYRFTGWNTDPDGAGTSYSEGATYSNDASVTLYAQWDPNTYTVRFDPNGGSYSAVNLPTQQFTYDVEQKLDWNRFDAPTNDHEFVGWKDDDDNVYTDEEEVKNLTTESDGTVILYAQWGPTLKDSAQEPSGYTSPNHTDESWKYVEFGYWPQTVKAADVTVDKSTSKLMGMFTYYLGSDRDWYVEQGGNYYKVEPIVWRVLTDNYNSTGNALLLAEKILTGGIKWADSKNDYMESNIRKWLNGNSETGENSDYNGTPGFLQTAFTADAQDLIAETEVDNSAASTNPAGESTLWNNGTNQYACDDTTDKIFLLSQKEASASEYGFAAYNTSGTGNTRIRVTTDYAKATGAYQDNADDYGGWWWLRSPDYDFESLARCIYYNGFASDNDYVSSTDGGVVPALCIPADRLP